MKVKTSVSVDSDLLKKAREKHLNVSGMLNRALYTKTHDNIDDPVETKKCKKCGNQDPNLVWLCPDEVWSCDRCLQREIRKIVVGVVPT